MSYHNPRIKLEDSVLDVVTNMAEGNPGALSVLMSLISAGASIDPDDFLAPLGSILHLDTADIYGSDIWVLYKDVCGMSTVNFVGLLRASQLGYTTDEAIHTMMNTGDMSQVAGLVNKVREFLPRFGQ